MSLSNSRKLAISSWVNDQFEVAAPHELQRKPREVARHPHWRSDPESGITGEVYLAPREVYYYAPDAPPRSGWWNIGPLPLNLRASSGQP